MSDHESHSGGGRTRTITSDLDNELNGWAECQNACRSTVGIIGAAIQRMRGAATELERDQIREATRGYFRRLAHGMLALSMAEVDRPADLVVTGEIE